MKFNSTLCLDLNLSENEKIVFLIKGFLKNYYYYSKLFLIECNNVHHICLVAPFVIIMLVL